MGQSNQLVKTFKITRTDNVEENHDQFQAESYFPTHKVDRFRAVSGRVARQAQRRLGTLACSIATMNDEKFRLEMLKTADGDYGL